MDEEARRRLIAEATLQHARREIKRARANLSMGLALLLIGAGILIAVAVLPLGLVGTLIIGGIGFVCIPGGLAVIVKAGAAIARANRQVRELKPPEARALRR